MKTRIRTHHFPGDVHRGEKIARWEMRLKDTEFITRKGMQTRKRVILERERAIMKERLQKDLKEIMDDMQ